MTKCHRSHSSDVKRVSRPWRLHPSTILSKERCRGPQTQPVRSQGSLEGTTNGVVVSSVRVSVSSVFRPLFLPASQREVLGGRMISSFFGRKIPKKTEQKVLTEVNSFRSPVLYLHDRQPLVRQVSCDYTVSVPYTDSVVKRRWRQIVRNLQNTQVFIWRLKMRVWTRRV